MIFDRLVASELIITVIGKYAVQNDVYNLRDGNYQYNSRSVNFSTTGKFAMVR